MTIEVTYNVTDIYISSEVSPIYIDVNYQTSGGGAAVWGDITGTLSNQTDLQTALDAKVPYSGATGNVNLGEYEMKAGQLTLDTSPTGTAAVGTTRWNDTIGSSETTLKGGSVVLKNGVDLVARVVNKVSPNTTLTKAAYQAVRVSGAQGQRLAVAFAQANNDNNSADTIGLVIETIATNQEGFIITVGQIDGINTTGSLQGETWLDGDVLYLSPSVAGALTNIKPTGATGHIVIVGYVEYAHANNGKIYVKVMNGWELDELHNVYISSVANNQGLFYNSTSSLWENKSISTVLGYTPEQPLTFSSPLSRLVNAISIPAATSSVNGYLSSTDWSTFNSKQGALTLTTTGTSGAATLVGNTLNIPQYSGGGGMAIGGSITSATAGSVLFAGTSGVLAQDNTNFFWDDTNDRLGIRTSSPNATLHVSGSTTASGAIARGVNYTPTLVAAANNDVLVGLDVNPTFTNGAFTGVSNYSLRLNNNIGILSTSAFGLNYFNIYALTTNQGISASFVANGTPTGHAYNFQFIKNSTGNSNSLLFIGGNASANGNNANKHVISTSCDGSVTTQQLVLRTAATSQSWSVVNDHLSIFGTGNVVIQNSTQSATDAGFRLDVQGTGRFTSDILVNSINIGRGGGNSDTNTAVGNGALTNNTTGVYSVAIGRGAMSGAHAGSGSVAVGWSALNGLTSGYENIAIGLNSLNGTSTGNYNVAIGSRTLESNNASDNVAVGGVSLQYITSGSGNTAIGRSSGRFVGSSGTVQNQTSSNSIYIGNGTRASANGNTNEIVLGYNSVGLGSNTMMLGNSSTTLTSLLSVLIIGATSANSSAQLQIDSTTKGFLPPRMTTTQKNAIASPVAGLVVYDTTLNKLCVYTTAWETITSI